MKSVKGQISMMFSSISVYLVSNDADKFWCQGYFFKLVSRHVCLSGQGQAGLLRDHYENLGFLGPVDTPLPVQALLDPLLSLCRN